MQHKGTPRSGRAGRPIQPTVIKGDHYRVEPRRKADGTWSYRAQVYNRTTKVREAAGTHATPEAAVAECQRRLGVLTNGPSISVAAVQHRWLEHKRAEHHEAKSIRYAEDGTAAFVEAYGTEPMAAVTR